MVNNEEEYFKAHQPAVDQDTDNLKVMPEVQLSQVDQDQIVKELAEKSEREASLTVAGSLKSLAGDTEFMGSISLATRLESGELSPEIMERAIEIYGQCFVPIGYSAPMRCGDGRGIEGAELLTDYELAVRPLGPQAMGASQTHGVAYRLTSKPDSAATLKDDINAVRSAIQATGSEVGLHTDNHEAKHAPGKTGCGAFNNVDNGKELYKDAEDKNVSVLASNTVGGKYSADAHEKQKELASEIPDNYAGDGVTLLNDLSETVGEASSQRYMGDHEEAIAGVNTVSGTVFNRELFNRRCERELGVVIQAFNIDEWAFQEVAEKLFPDDKQAQISYVTACADWQARPCKYLTDGTITAVVRTPVTV